MDSCAWLANLKEERAAGAAHQDDISVGHPIAQEKKLLPEPNVNVKEFGSSLGKFVLGAMSAEEEDELLQEEAHELELQQTHQEEAHERDIAHNKMEKSSNHIEQKPLQKKDSTVLDRVTGFISSTLRAEAAVFCPPLSSVQERVQENWQHQLQHDTFRPGDYVKLTALKNKSLNNEMGTVQEKLETGRFCVMLGDHKLNQKGCIKLENLSIVATGKHITAVTELRDNGRSVAELIAEGYTVSAIQRDSSEKLCGECCRPRYMCSCTYKCAGRV